MYEQYDRLLSFASVHQAIRAERLTAAAGLATAMIPTPRAVTLSCGQCLLFAADAAAAVLALLTQHEVVWNQYWQRPAAGEDYQLIERRDDR